MDRERFDKWCERAILALVLGIVVFGPLATGAVRTLEFLVIQGLTLGVIVLWGLRFWLQPRPKLLWPPICWAVVAFVGYAIARYLTADIEYVARQELIRILVYAVLFLAILNNLHRQESVQIITFTLIFLAMAISFYALYQFITGSDRVWHFINPYKHRGTGTYINPNHLAGFLEMLLPLGLAYTLIGRLKPVTKVLVGYATLVILAGIVVTLSRGGWLATGMTLLLFFGLLAWNRNYRLPALVLLAVLVIGGNYFVTRAYYLQKRVRQTFAEMNVDTDMRYELWGATARMWKDHFWWGVGPGHFDYCFRPYRPERLQGRPDHAHNEYLDTLADWGLAGTLIVAAAWMLLYWGAFKTWRQVHKPENDFATSLSNRFAFVLGAALGLWALLLHSVVDFNMHIPANAILAISLMAMLTSHLRFATECHWRSVRLPGKVVATALLLAGFMWLGWQEWRRGHEYVWLARAAKAPSFSRAQIAALERAFGVEPMNSETSYAIGEAYRVQSWQGNDDYEDLANKAIDWFAQGMKLNPHDGYNYLRYGMCLDWTGRQTESGPYFERAEELDPSGYFTLANIGWHYVQLGDYAAAKPWFERSRRLQWKENPIATSYLEIVGRKMAEGAAPSDIFAKEKEPK